MLLTLSFLCLRGTIRRNEGVKKVGRAGGRKETEKKNKSR